MDKEARRRAKAREREAERAARAAERQRCGLSCPPAAAASREGAGGNPGPPARRERQAAKLERRAERAAGGGPPRPGAPEGEDLCLPGADVPPPPWLPAGGGLLPQALLAGAPRGDTRTLLFDAPGRRRRRPRPRGAGVIEAWEFLGSFGEALGLGAPPALADLEASLAEPGGGGGAGARAAMALAALVAEEAFAAAAAVAAEADPDVRRRDLESAFPVVRARQPHAPACLGARAQAAGRRSESTCPAWLLGGAGDGWLHARFARRVGRNPAERQGCGARRRTPGRRSRGGCLRWRRRPRWCARARAAAAWTPRSGPTWAAARWPRWGPRSCCSTSPPGPPRPTRAPPRPRCRWCGPLPWPAARTRAALPQH